MNQKEYVAFVEELETRLILRAPRNNSLLEQIQFDMKAYKQHNHLQRPNPDEEWTFGESIQRYITLTETDDGIVKLLFNIMYFHLAENKSEIAKDTKAFYAQID